MPLLSLHLVEVSRKAKTFGSRFSQFLWRYIALASKELVLVEKHTDNMPSVQDFTVLFHCPLNILIYSEVQLFVYQDPNKQISHFPLLSSFTCPWSR